MPTLRPSRILDPAVESQSPEERRVRQGERLRRTVAHAFARAPRARRTLTAAGIDPSSVHGLDDLLRIPVTRKDSLPSAQAEEPPFAGLTAVDPGQLARIFMSPGPIYDPQAPTRTSGASATRSPRPASAPGTWPTTRPPTT